MDEKWNAGKIKFLRCRLGFSQSELARRLKCDAGLVRSWESVDKTSGMSILEDIELHSETLVLLENQAETLTDQILQGPLAETVLDETQESQVNSEDVRRRFDI